MKVKKALTIAGSDGGGGAGIQADLKTFQELEVYGMSAITAITAQNTLGVQGVYPMTVDAILEQIQSIADDLNPDAIKTGMLFSGEIITAISKEIEKNHWNKIIVDPVMVAKGGSKLLQDEAIEALKSQLIPLGHLITPNIPEAEVITGINIKTLDDRKKAARHIYEMGAKHVLIKGGHSEENEVIDLLFDGNQFTEFKSLRIETIHTHGTGCTFAAAITSEVAKGKNIIEAVEVAKEFIHLAIKDELGIGSGHGPTNHWAYRKRGATIK